MKNESMDLGDLENISGGSQLFSSSKTRFFELEDPQRTGYLDQLDNITIDFKNFAVLKPDQEEILRSELRRKLTAAAGRPKLGIEVKLNGGNIEVISK